MHRHQSIAAVALAAAVGLTTSGCLSSAKAPTGSAQAGTAKTTISVMYNFGSARDEAFRQDLNAFAEKNGITIDYQQSDQFETLIQTKVSADQAPDIAIFPQPGILRGFAEKGKLADLSTQTDVDSVKNDILPGFLDAATVDGTVYGAPISMNVKSLYWYDKDNFASAGLTPPTTNDELLALIDKVKASGKTPLCFGLGSDSATGWPGTDWIEDYMLQTNSTDVYDKWVTGEVKFDSPEVRKAFDIYTTIVMTDGNVYGGAKNSAAIKFSDAFTPMFKSDPGCYFGKQGNFITSFFPEEILADLDAKVGVFATPSVNGEHPVLGGGDLAAAFTKDDANVKKVMNFLVNDATFGVNIAKSGAALSPHKSFDASNYPNDLTREVAKIATDASVFRFDGSDQMPAAVGAKSFWTAMVDYTTGAASLDQVLKDIDDSWPS